MKKAPRIPPRFYWYMAGLWLLAALAVGIAGQLQPGLAVTSSHAITIAFILVVFIGLAGAMPLELAPTVKINIGAAPLFAATLLFPATIAAVIGLAGTVGYYSYFHLRRRRTWQDVAFNSGRVVLQIAVAGAVFHSLAIGQWWQEIAFAPTFVLAALGAGAAYYLINVLSVHLATALVTGQNPARLWWSSLAIEGPQQAALLLFGVVTALVVNLFPILGLAMVFPVCVVYYSLRSSIALRVHTQSAVEAIADAVDMRSFGTTGHSRRVATLSAQVAMRLGMSQDEVELVRRAARVHDIGKIGFSDAVLRREGALSTQDEAALRLHPRYGAEILAPFAEYQRCRHLVRLHHEQPDGGGYPDGRAGSQVPLGASIIAVVEAFDALTSERLDSEAMSATLACAELQAGADTRWNERAVQGLIDEIQAKSPARSEAGSRARVGARL
jgi:hypothetical protein